LDSAGLPRTDLKMKMDHTASDPSSRLAGRLGKGDR
jgi:hypothetical protein